MASTSDKSSGLKSNSTPSTPQAESVNVHMESLPTESTNSADHLSEARPDRELPGDNFLGQETPLVRQFDFLYEMVNTHEKVNKRKYVKK